MLVNEYVTRFTQLSHYVPGDVDTDGKKQDCFLNGLNDGLAYVHGEQGSGTGTPPPYRVMEHKRKLEHQNQNSNNSRPWVGSSSVGPIHHPIQ
jgi:hypothetical protein